LRDLKSEERESIDQPYVEIGSKRSKIFRLLFKKPKDQHFMRYMLHTPNKFYILDTQHLKPAWKSREEENNTFD
jgi:hypothetical protein